MQRTMGGNAKMSCKCYIRKGATNTLFLPNDVEIHFCQICAKSEKCLEEYCDFREEYGAHGYCMAKIKGLSK